MLTNYFPKQPKTAEFKTIDQCLQSKFGYAAFRPAQRAVVESVLSGHDTFVLMPTGAGRCRVCQSACLCVRACACCGCVRVACVLCR